MTDLLQSVALECPYCAEPIDILVDCSVDEQDYTEDCTVCCQPILLQVRVSPAGEANVSAQPENG